MHLNSIFSKINNPLEIKQNINGRRYWQTSGSSEKSRKSLLPDVCHQRKIEEIAAARRLSPAKTRGNRCCQTDRFFFINVSYKYSVQYLKEIWESGELIWKYHVILVPIIAFAQCLFTDACTAMKLFRYRNFGMNLCTLPYFICAIGWTIFDTGVCSLVWTYSAMW